MTEMLGYQVDEVAVALSFDPTTLIEIAVYIIYRYLSLCLLYQNYA